MFDTHTRTHLPGVSGADLAALLSQWGADCPPSGGHH